MLFTGNEKIDVHMHVGLLGDEFPDWGKFSDKLKNSFTYKVFLLYGRIPSSKATDRILRKSTVEIIQSSKLDHVVCLALDPVFDLSGNKRMDLTDMWVHNDYVLDLQKDLGNKVLLGASVHPYDPDFETRIKYYVDKGAVLLKWLPSSQQINLADVRIKTRLKFLATVKNGKPLPLLLHCGIEHAIPTSDNRTKSFDCLSWSWKDDITNFFRFNKKWYKPDPSKIEENLKYGLNEGAVIIFGHTGLPYFSTNKIIEHSEFDTVKGYLQKYSLNSSIKGRCYADLSATVTPVRRAFYNEIKKLPEDFLLFGSDFPTPVFELSGDIKENIEDLKAILKGHFERVIVPQDNLLDVNFRELNHYFPGHKMFTNFANLLKNTSG